MRVVAVANQKGGCGKTTSAVNLSACLAFLGKRTLLVDLDSQGHASLGLGVTPEELEHTLYDVLSPRAEEPPRLTEIVVKLNPHLHLIPSDLTLSALEQELSGATGRERRLADAFAEIGEGYDYVFLDCAPGLSLMTFNALRLCDEVLVPIEASLYSLHGLARFIETVRLAEEEFEKSYVFHALITNFDKRTRMARRFLDEVREYLKEMAFKTVVRRNVRLADAATAGKAITDFDRRSYGFKDYMSCTTELIERGLRRDAPAKQSWEMKPHPLETAEAAAEAVSVAPASAREKPAPIELKKPAAPTETKAPVIPPAAPPPVALPAAARPIDRALDRGRSQHQTAAPSTTISGGGPPKRIDPAPNVAILDDDADDEAEERETPEIKESPKGIIAEILAVKAPEGVEKLTLTPKRPEARATNERASGGLKLGGGDVKGGAIGVELRGPVVRADGVLFALAAPSAESVKIAGEFNDWRPEDLKLARPERGIWELDMPLDEGAYRYKFIINGEWMNDPHNVETMANPFGGNDSVVHVRP
jgi:chromosome partitioning protein